MKNVKRNCTYLAERVQRVVLSREPRAISDHIEPDAEPDAIRLSRRPNGRQESRDPTEWNVSGQQLHEVACGTAGRWFHVAQIQKPPILRLGNLTQNPEIQ